MPRNPETDLSEDPKSVEVSATDTHATVQCDSVNLYSSTLQFLDPDSEEKATRIVFRVRALVADQVVLCDLETQVVFIPDAEEPLFGWLLNFTLIGRFSASKELTPDALGEFIKFNGLTILWPYAREYASNQIGRVGEYQLVLPVINPQTVTRQLIEEDRIEVVFVDQSDEETA